MKKLILFFVLAFSSQLSFGQIEDVHYKLKYNSESCLFDVFLVVNQGHTKSIRDRVQMNAQISIVAPKDANVYVEESFMPLQDNQEYRSSTPTDWEVRGEAVAPQGLENSKVVAIAPSLIPSSFYNDIHEGDEIKLFSFSVTPLTQCGQNVRLFENGQDPNSGDAGMNGKDFSNGFTIGGVAQRYSGNDEAVYPIAPQITKFNVLTQNTIAIDLNVVSAQSPCQRSLTYEFFGPQGYVGDYNALTSIPSHKIGQGQYKMVVTDEIGCKTEKTFYPLHSVSNATLSENVDINRASDIRSFDGKYSSSIYPNPAQNIFTLTVQGAKGAKVKVDILDMKGSVLRSNIVEMKMENEVEEININADLTPGLYNVNVVVSGQTMTHKLLIIK